MFVAGREYERTPDVVVTEDIAPFPWFRWEDGFTYDVALTAKRVTLSAPGLPPRACFATATATRWR